MGQGRPAATGILTLKFGLAPIARRDAGVLILGSLPGDASWAAQRYYAHPRNQFWQLISGVMGVDMSAMNYPARIVALKAAGIALWDVVGEAQRPGSLDQKIKAAKLNDLRALVGQLPHLRAVAFNGKKAAALAERTFSASAIDIIRLPSSSAAYTADLSTKSLAWGALSRYLAISEDPHRPVPQ